MVGPQAARRQAWRQLQSGATCMHAVQCSCVGAYVHMYICNSLPQVVPHEDAHQGAMQGGTQDGR